MRVSYIIYILLLSTFFSVEICAQDIRLGISCQVEHEAYTQHQALGLIGFNISAQISHKVFYGELTLGPQNSYYRYNETHGDARFYGNVNRLRIGIGGGVYIINKDHFKWSFYTSVLQGISFQKRVVYPDLAMDGIYRLQLQPGIRFQVNDFVVGFHYGYNVINEFSKKQAFILGGTFGIVF